MDFSKLNLINLALAMCSVLEWGKSVLLASIHGIHEAERNKRNKQELQLELEIKAGNKLSKGLENIDINGPQ